MSGERSGVLVVDKPRGPTSHDVVATMRRRLGTRRVGHAGTLDPMATGVLVILFGEGTKLEPFLSSARKVYRAGVELGRSTTTLDAEGDTTEEAPVPGEVLAEIARLESDPRGPGGRVEAALQLERGRLWQVPPAFSAIKVAKIRSHTRARAGEAVELEARPVVVHEARLLSARAPAALELQLDVSKGYYVRAFARDLGAALGCPAHLGALARIRSGPFDLQAALDLDDRERDPLASALSLAQAAARSLASLHLDETQERLARAGRGLDPERVSGAAEIPEGARVALLDTSSRRLIAVCERRPAELAILRVFHDLP
ncbi:MAG: tRNA pseudouridine(55) synthase TruB [Polyangiaceae bacterium]|nr:tRNA pseudouridine(55) synthase TruB [Polyangiaceae bacterium]